MENENKPKVKEGKQYLDKDGNVLHAELQFPGSGYSAVISARVAERDENGRKMYDEQSNPIHGELKYDFEIRKEGTQRATYQGTITNFNDAYKSVMDGFSKRLDSNGSKDISDKLTE